MQALLKYLVAGAAMSVLASYSAMAQDKAGGTSLPTSPFASTTPGQAPTANASPDTPTGLELGLLDWSPIPTRCAFVDPDKSVKPSTETTFEPFVFLTMTQSGSGTTVGPERGYVMANGLVRELEKGKTAPNKDGQVVTVWRSAGEPRINVNIVLADARQENGTTRYSGSMTLFWGDKKESVAITGSCEN
ncbi:hypothetical protein VSX64_20305 [Aurantimonas sp. C2-6-R+9]|uniref:hypothetical protein n=1 Tax=unclassified Aurantimonas TaxID=2638230 RepID=UPI002E176086|nr:MULTISPECIES: hypothetical protein [unclassified Aurantimonas]MEC5293011.1 hypothetical protein [Aurantimonas sp. C2-3-R2]MEC5322508.1 hypothetical protein [Aurantimonas sp. A3-2-R12]MEC5383171.1 hypothetical protein [Aurantimonas sp. C2-6-R+9]MEC5414064.1 hypothetical protein [Aurantimonas sp. C2-4-R8]